MIATLRLLRDVTRNPSGWDSYDNYCGEIPEEDWLFVLSRTRDSDILTESNFASALKKLGGEGDNVTIDRFGHWACGWWETLSVRGCTPEAEVALQIVRDLDNYPILDEEDYSERSDAEAQRVWAECYDTRDRIDFVRGHRGECWFASWADLRAAIRGDHYPGYAQTIL